MVYCDVLLLAGAVRSSTLRCLPANVHSIRRRRLQGMFVGRRPTGRLRRPQAGQRLGHEPADHACRRRGAWRGYLRTWRCGGWSGSASACRRQCRRRVSPRCQHASTDARFRGDSERAPGPRRRAGLRGGPRDPRPGSARGRGRGSVTVAGGGRRGGGAASPYSPRRGGGVGGGLARAARVGQLAGAGRGHILLAMLAACRMAGSRR